MSDAKIFIPGSLVVPHLKRIVKESATDMVFGNRFLDEALGCIFKHDFVLVGAETGAGKTQFSTNLALANAALGKRVVFFALEAEEHEIQSRLMYQTLAGFYFNDPHNQKGETVTYTRYKKGKLGHVFEPYLEAAESILAAQLENIFPYYPPREEEFTAESLESTMIDCLGSKMDLVIIDHAHYFDYDADKENKALKTIAKTVRKMTLRYGLPVVLVAHLRKTDRRFRELAPGVEEFHGSSDLTKIATRVVTLGRGGPSKQFPGCFETFIRIGKNRYEGSTTAYVSKVFFDPRVNDYRKELVLGRLADMGREFVAVDRDDLPLWAKPLVNKETVTVP